MAYFLKRHSLAKSNYKIYNKELIIIIYTFKEWRPKLKGSRVPIDVITDHRNLKYFMLLKQLLRR